jgi:hypothetical protein
VNLRRRIALIAFPLLAVALIVGPAAAQEGSRDNSGRQIAVVVPGMPNPVPVTPVAAVKAVKPVKAKESAGVKPRPLHEMGASMMTPEMKDAAQKGLVIAQGLSGVAMKRAGDIAGWVSTMYNELSETTPVISPAREFKPPMPSAKSMRPLEAVPGRTLYWTNENRLKTVVGQ